MVKYSLRIMDNNVHTEKYFMTALGTVFPEYNNKTIKHICTIIHKGGSSVCTVNTLERIEHFKTSLEKFGLECRIERDIQ